MADRKQQNSPDRQDRPSEERNSQTTDPNRQREGGAETDRQAQTRGNEETGQNRQNENVESGNSGTRKTEQGI